MIVDAFELIHVKDLVSTVVTHEITQRHQRTHHDELFLQVVDLVL